MGDQSVTAAQYTMTAGEIAGSLGVSDETVRNWHAAGGVKAVEGSDGFLRFCLAECSAYKAAYADHRLSGRGKGGRRKGAGRKSRAEKAAEKTGTLVATAGGGASPAREDAGTPSVGTEGDLDTSPKMLDSWTLRRAMLPADQNGMTISEAERQLKVTAASRHVLELRQQAGQTIDREDAEAAWGEAFNAIRRAVLNIPGRCRGALAAALGLEPVKAARAANVVRDEVESALAELAADVLKALPGSGAMG